MPPLILLGLLGAAAYLGVQQMKKEATRVSARNRRAEMEARNKAQGTLVRGDDGVYRLERD
ncbi:MULTISPECIES: hypothetical protein [Aureimonas]|uniref:Uncharacterized protein n=2 Tax=Aureimonas altamirensis TaxID=370622 RepID=A0A0B1QAX0_9HYPH|nr:MULTISPECIES: hypothetical protein [Aureimonas]KHJ55980.1 hypothetical protein LA66_05020 [Aureimonas altamirensis]QOG08145.1 hypothetical protein IGS74_08260 [Aureimonas sp. OT7]SHJ27865.1 hypothetical protein SAMN02745911_2256 [Aureimonas altamirensis DSM 21988]